MGTHRPSTVPLFARCPRWRALQSRARPWEGRRGAAVVQSSTLGTWRLDYPQMLKGYLSMGSVETIHRKWDQMKSSEWEDAMPAPKQTKKETPYRCYTEHNTVWLQLSWVGIKLETWKKVGSPKRNESNRQHIRITNSQHSGKHGRNMLQTFSGSIQFHVPALNTTCA